MLRLCLEARPVSLTSHSLKPVQHSCLEVSCRELLMLRTDCIRFAQLTNQLQPVLSGGGGGRAAGQGWEDEDRNS